MLNTLKIIFIAAVKEAPDGKGRGGCGGGTQTPWQIMLEKYRQENVESRTGSRWQWANCVQMTNL